MPRRRQRRRCRSAFFTPAEEHHQRGLGEHIIGVFRESGAHIIAEDLGTVPDFVRESLERLQVPGYRVLRWEREWHHARAAVPRPRALSRALARDHRHARHRPARHRLGRRPPDERAAIAALPDLSNDGSRIRQRHARRGVEIAATRRAPISSVIPIQDLFGWRDRINTPCHGRRHQLDVAPALARRSPRRRARRARARRDAASVGRQHQPILGAPRIARLTAGTPHPTLSHSRAAAIDTIVATPPGARTMGGCVVGSKKRSSARLSWPARWTAGTWTRR